MVANDSERISVIETKVDMFIDEIREQNRMRAAEIRAMDEKILKLQESTDAKFGKLEEKIDSMDKHVRNLAVTVMIGIGAMVVAVIGITYAVISKM